MNSPNGNHLSEQRLEAVYGLCGAHFATPKCRFLEETGRVVGNVKGKASGRLDSWRRHDKERTK